MSEAVSVEATFCFVDIAGYTALTESHGDLAAADLVDDFCKLVRESIFPDGHFQSLIGDCAFLLFPDPITATRALLRLYRLIADRHSFPIVRAGLHHGSALMRDHHHVGTTVNIAARIAAQATGGQILCTDSVTDCLRSVNLADIDIVHKGSIYLKNLPDPVELYELMPSDAVRTYAVDPVCRMQVDIHHAVGDLHFNGKTYWFCSLKCVERFSKHPKTYS